MPQEMKHKEALKIAVETEKAMICFYRRAAEMAIDKDAKSVFARLSKEKEEHAGNFFRHYSGDDFGTFENFINQPCTFNAAVLKELNGLDDISVKERRAREIAMEKELKLEKSLLNTARQIIDPGVRSVFEQMAKATRNHYQIIESEYARRMGMPHETDIDTYVRE